MHELEACATCKHYRRLADDPERGICVRGDDNDMRERHTPTRAASWCAKYRNYITGRKDAAPRGTRTR